MNQTFDVGMLEGNYVIDGIVTMNDGIIKNNPFSISVKKSAAATWLLENRDRAISRIRETMLSQRLGTHEVDECFDYAVYFFLEDPSREYKADYFGPESGDTYTVEIYCLTWLPKIVFFYRNEMRTRLKNTVHLIDRDKDDAEVMPKRCISYDLLPKASFDDELSGYGFNEVMEFEELQELLDIVIPFYDEEFSVLGLVNFDFKKYVYHMFLSDRDIMLEKNQLSEDSLVSIAESLGMTVSGLKRVNLIVKEAFTSRKNTFDDLKDVLHRLVEGKVKGWRPVLTGI